MTETRETTGEFTGQDGSGIFFRHYVASPEQGRVVIAHGLGEHSGRYGHVAARMVECGCSVWALDHRGHGKSQGRRGHILSFDHYLADLAYMVKMVLEGRPEGVKLFLLGHSMGGLIALNFALNFPELIDGVIASSPALGVTVEVPAVKRLLGRVMSGLWPGLQMANGLDATKISHDPEVVRDYQDDPLVHDRVSARWFTEFMAAMERTNAMASGMAGPVLMQVAGDDHLANAGAARAFFNALEAKDKTLHLYEGLYHEIYNERTEDRERVLNDLVEWLTAHM